MSQHLIDGSLGFLLNKGTQAFHREINRNFQRNKMDITFEQWSVMIYLFHCDGRSQNEIALKTFKDKVSVTKIVDNLVKRNLVLRNPDKNDRRVNRIYLTEDGAKIVPKLRKIALATLSEAFSGIEEEEIENFKKTISTVVENLTGDDLLNFIKNNKGRWK
jgi:DNA-binding MarR family transcriptional regulator